MNYTIEDHPLRIIALDSLIDGEVCGIVNADQRGWLDAEFSRAPDRPTIIILHHPPVHTGVPWLDTFGLREANEFGGVIGRHPQILRVLSGHYHWLTQSL